MPMLIIQSPLRPTVRIDQHSKLINTRYRVEVSILFTSRVRRYVARVRENGHTHYNTRANTLQRIPTINVHTKHVYYESLCK